MDRPIPPWELEQEAAALDELKASECGSSRSQTQFAVREPSVPQSQSSNGVEATEPSLTELAEHLALKKAAAALLIQQVDRMIAEGKADSSLLQG
ncbi:MAG: hypothetical protein M3R04_06755, partial [bacterium]|nr:hypothetical protein [bacterium]